MHLLYSFLVPEITLLDLQKVRGIAYVLMDGQDFVKYISMSSSVLSRNTQKSQLYNICVSDRSN